MLLLIVGVPVAHYSQASVESAELPGVTPGVMYRSGQMTPAGLTRTLDEYRIRTVISFRDARDSNAPPPDEFETDLCQTARRGLSPARATTLVHAGRHGARRWQM